MVQSWFGAEPAPSGEWGVAPPAARRAVDYRSDSVPDLPLVIVNLQSRLAGQIAFALGAARTILGFHPSQTCVRIDDKRAHDGGTTLVAISNGRYFGGGMHIAPGAEIVSSALQVLVPVETS